MTIKHKGSIFTDNAEHIGQFFERPDWLSSVAFGYQSPARGIETELAPLEKRNAPYQILETPKLTIRTNPDHGLTKGEIDITYLPMTPDAEMEIDFDVEKDGHYRIDAIIMRSLFTAQYQISLDGNPIGGVRDCWQTGQDPVWEALDLHILKAGTHTLKFKGHGPSPQARTSIPPVNGLSIGTITLLRLEDLTGYHETLNIQLEKRKAKK